MQFIQMGLIVTQWCSKCHSDERYDLGTEY